MTEEISLTTDLHGLRCPLELGRLKANYNTRHITTTCVKESLIFLDEVSPHYEDT